MTRNYFQKKYIAFVLVVALMSVSSLVKVECPVCQGTGLISTTPGMDRVVLDSSSYKELFISRDTCALFIVYGYEVTISLKNNGSSDTSGYVKCVLKEYQQARVLDTQYIPVSIPKESIVETSYDINFTTGLDVPLKAEVEIKVESGDFEDRTCGGSGRIPLNYLSLAGELGKQAEEQSRIERLYVPPPFVVPDIEEFEEIWMWEEYINQ